MIRFTLLLFALLWPIAGFAESAWQKMLQGCVSFIATGMPGAPDTWALRDVSMHKVVFSLINDDGAIIGYPLVAARLTAEPVCEIASEAKPAGNDSAGLALRQEAHDALDPALAFHERDQTGPADVWRGCAEDGQEFRLLSMTQTTYAYFWIAVSPHDPECSYIGS